MRPDAIHRLLSILLLLRGGRTQTAEALATDFGVNLRTIYRDIRKLQSSGFSIVAAAGPGGGYTLATGGDLASLLYGDDTALAGLLTGGSLFRLGARREAVEEVLRRAKDLIPREEREILERARSRIHVDGGEWYWRDKPEHDLQVFKDAVLNDRTLAITFTERDQPTIFADTVHPYGLVWKGGFWYLIAFSPRDGTFRRFRVQRVVHAEFTGESFRRDPSFDLAAFWRQDLERFGVGATRVLLRIEAAVIPEFEHFDWKAENRITKATDHWLVEMHVDRFEWLVPLILSYGGRITAIEPESLRARVAEGAEHLSRVHVLNAPPSAESKRTGDCSDIRSRAVRGRG